MKFPPFTRVFRDLKGFPGECVHAVRGLAQVELPPTSLQQSTTGAATGETLLFRSPEQFSSFSASAKAPVILTLEGKATINAPNVKK